MSSRDALSGDNLGALNGTGASYQSSWGGGSSWGAQPEQSSWASERLGVNRLEGKQPDSLATRSNQNVEAASAATSSGDLSGSSNASPTSYTNPYGAANLKSSRKSTISSKYAISSTSRRSESDIRPGEIGPVGTTADSEMNIGNTADITASGGKAGPTNGPSKNKKPSTAKALTFFPAAYAESYSFGESPFSSPGGVGELNFLSPDILAATSHGSARSLTRSYNEDPGANSLRQAFFHKQTLATSASHYGLATHPYANHPKTGLGAASEAGKRTHLKTSIFDSNSADQ